MQYNPIGSTGCTTRIRVWFSRCFYDPQTRHGSAGHREWDSFEHWSHGRVGDILVGDFGLCVLFFLLPLQSFSTARNWNSRNSFCFPGLTADSGLKKGRLPLAFESAFRESAMSFAVDKLPLKDSTRVFWTDHSSGMSPPAVSLLEDGGFNTRHFWATEGIAVDLNP